MQELSTSAPEPAAASRKRKRILVISQTFVPDPASVGQHMTDVAVELARRGYDVRAYASARGYENPNIKYPRREILHGVDVRRLPLASFGKSSIPIRVLGTAAFMSQVLWLQLFTPQLGGIFFSTSPPLVGLTSCITRFFRRTPLAYWAMDLNPDQLITMGKIKERSFIARFLEFANRTILNRSQLIIALDRFMAERLLKRGDYRDKMIVMPPWPHEDQMEAIDQTTNPFRIKHGLVGKRVIMYSGNHSPANPLGTLLATAVKFRDDDRVRFLFVGGGSGKKEVDECIKKHGLTNVVSLPYQPLAELKYSLSAGDVHVVSMGQKMAGIIHPCKIYGAMAVGRPILYLGPSPSHVSDLLDAHQFGWHVNHGDTVGMETVIGQILEAPQESLNQMGAIAQEVLGETLSQKILCGRLVDRFEAICRKK
jgi:colanic acid biosynthesis glycosyl transferase WcaI